MRFLFEAVQVDVKMVIPDIFVHLSRLTSITRFDDKRANDDNISMLKPSKLKNARHMSANGSSRMHLHLANNYLLNSRRMQRHLERTWPLTRPKKVRLNHP